MNIPNYHVHQKSNPNYPYKVELIPAKQFESRTSRFEAHFLIRIKNIEHRENIRHSY